MITFENGVHDIPNELYHASSGVSRSALWDIKKSPLHYWSNYLSDNKQEKKESSALIVGELTHALVMEPDEVSKRFALAPELEKLPDVVRKKDVGAELYELNKSLRAEAKARNDLIMKQAQELSIDKVVVSRNDYDMATRLCEAVYKNPTAEYLFKSTHVEKSIYFTHKETGVQCKVRPDSWAGAVITDLKTCIDASPGAFKRAALDKGYYLQAAMIREGLRSLGVEMETFVFFCVEKTAPFATVYYTVTNEVLEFGLNQFNDLMQQYKWCLDNNKWHSYEPQELTLPNFLKRED